MVKLIRTHGECFVSATMGHGIERRGDRYAGMYLYTWYGDPSYRYSLDMGDGKHYYYYHTSSKIEIEDADFNLIEIIL